METATIWSRELKTLKSGFEGNAIPHSVRRGPRSSVIGGADVGRGNLAKKQEEVQRHRAMCFKLKQQREALKLGLAAERLKAKEARIVATNVQSALSISRNEVDQLKFHISRMTKGETLPYDTRQEITMKKELFDRLPEYSYSLPDFVDRVAGFMWRRKETPPWSPYSGIADEWLVGELLGLRPDRDSTVKIKWYKVILQG